MRTKRRDAPLPGVPARSNPVALERVRSAGPGSHATLGDVDLYVATRAATADAFGTPVRLPQLSTTSLDGVSWESPDGCRLYIANNSLGTPDVYVASRPQ